MNHIDEGGGQLKHTGSRIPTSNREECHADRSTGKDVIVLEVINELQLRKLARITLRELYLDCVFALFQIGSLPPFKSEHPLIVVECLVRIPRGSKFNDGWVNLSQVPCFCDPIVLSLDSCTAMDRHNK